MTKYRKSWTRDCLAIVIMALIEGPHVTDICSPMWYQMVKICTYTLDAPLTPSKKANFYTVFKSEEEVLNQGGYLGRNVTQTC